MFIYATARRCLQVVGCNIGPIGFYETRLNKNHVNTKITQLHTQGIRERLHGILGGMIPAAKIAHQTASHRADIDNSATPLYAHIRKNLFGKLSQAEDIYLKLVVRFIRSHICNGSKRSIACIVYQYVNTSLLANHPLNHGSAGIRIGNIQAQGVNTTRDQRRDFLDTSSGTVNNMALLGKSFRSPVAHAAACSRYENDF